MSTTRRKLIQVRPEGVQRWGFDPTANVRQRHKRRLRFARKHRGHLQAFCDANGIGIRERRTTQMRAVWSLRKNGIHLISWVPELARAVAPSRPDLVFKIHDPFVLAWFVEGMLKVESGQQ